MGKLYRFMFATLRGRLIICVAIVNAVMMALFVADLTMRQRDILLEHQIDHATALSQMLANSATGLIVTDKIAGIQQLLDAQQNYPGLLFVMITDQQGHILAQSGQSGHEDSLSVLPRQARQSLLSRTQSLVDVATPVKLGEQHMGWARVGLGQQETGQKLAQITQSGITYAMAAIFISSIIVWLMGRLITGRLYAIQKTINQVRAGNSDSRSLLSGCDEAAMMAHEFNAMLDSMAERVMLAELSAEIGLSLTKQNDLPFVLNECAVALVRHLDVAFARIWTLNPAENVLELQASAGMYTRIDGSHSRVPFGKFKIGIIAEQREPHITNAIIGDPQVTDQEWAQREGMVAFAGHPLLVDDKLVGVMGMFSRRALTDITIKALASVANAIAIGIERKQAAEQLNQLAAIVQSSDDAITAKSLDGIITSWNRGAEKIYGYSASEMLGKSVTMLIPPGKINELTGILERIKAGEHIEHYEALRLRKDGVEIQMSLTVSPVRDAGGRIVAASAIGRDITEHKRAEETLHRLNRELRAISDCNQVLMRARDEQALLSEICDIVCSEAGYHMAWVGFAENDTAKSITPAAWGGAEDGYLSEACFNWDDTDLGRAPAGVAIRSGSSSCIQDFTIAPHAAPWREMALQRGYRSSIALPLKDENHNTFGVICIYSTKPDTFTPDEIRLLEELASDLSFGIMLIRSRAERKQAEQALKLASGYNRSLIEASLDPLVTIGSDGTITDVNLATEQATGCRREELIGTDFADYFTEPSRARAGYQQVFQEGKVRDYALDLRHRDGGVVPVLYNASLFRDEEGRVKGVFAAARDITELKHAEQALRLANRYNRSLIEANLDPLVTIGSDGTITDVNLATEQATGCCRDELIGTDFADYFTEPPRARAGYQQVFQEGKVRDYALDLRHRDGSIIPVLYNASLFRDQEGQVKGVFAAARDITELKQAELALKLANSYNRSLIEANLDPLVTIGPDGTITDVNHATETATGCCRDELIGTDFADYFTEPPRARAGYQQVFQEGKVRDYALDLRHRDGEVVPVLYNASLFRDEEGRVKGVFAAARDITELKHAENEIRYLKNYLANIIDSMPSMLVGMDRDENVTQWNLQAKAATGITAMEAIGKPIGQVLPDFTPWIVAVREEIRQRRPASIEKLLVEKDGKQYYYDLTLYPLIANCIEGTVVRIEDVTERTRIQELMIQTEKMMSVGGLAAGMAHEINNPLGIITQAAQNIERRVSPDLPANQKAAQETGVPMEQLNSYFQQRQIPEFIASIREAAARASRIIANILRFSRQADSVMQQVALPSIMDQAVELAANDYDLKKKFDFRSIEIIRNYQPELPLMSVVATEIEQVLLNLLKNAAQAMITNPPERKPCILLRIRREERYAILEVEDNGPGMTEDIRRRVFEPFFTTKEPGIGTGLGLSVSYMIVTQNHKGLMEVASKPGNGARFSIRLPLEKESGHVR